MPTELHSSFIMARTIVAQCQMSYIPALSWQEQLSLNAK